MLYLRGAGEVDEITRSSTLDPLSEGDVVEVEGSQWLVSRLIAAERSTFADGLGYCVPADSAAERP